MLRSSSTPVLSEYFRNAQAGGDKALTALSAIAGTGANVSLEAGKRGNSATSPALC